MSYILDALRKADAQRARDPARGIHAQPLATLDGGRGAARRRWAIGASIAGLSAIAAAVWVLWGRAPAPAQQEEAQRMARTAPAPVPVQPVVAPPLAPPVAPPVVQLPGGNIVPPPVVRPPSLNAQVTLPPPAAALPPAQAMAGGAPQGGDPRNSSRPPMRGRPQPMTIDPAAPMQAAPAGPPPAAATLPSTASQAPVLAANPAAPGMQPPPGMAPPPAAMAPAPGPAAIAPPQPANAPPPAPVAGLPPDAPKLSISGGVYSSNRAQRMLVVNGLVFSEGSEIAQGVVLEQVQAKTAILRFRGARYTVGY